MSAPVSFWEQRWLDKADIVIIGAGLVGMQSALKLKQKFAHRKVWVFEASNLGSPASLRNAGFACFGSLGEIIDDSANIGREAALGLYEQRYRGFMSLKNTYGETAMGYENSGGYELFKASDQATVDALLPELDQVNSDLWSVHGQTAFVPKKSQSLGMNVHDTCIASPIEGAIQSHLLYETVRKHALSVGVEFYSGWKVLQFSQLDSGKYRVEFVDNNAQIIAQELVICTNGFTREIYPELEVFPARGQVLVTESVPSMPFRGIFHYDKGYIYFRSLGTRLLIGGARNIDFEGETTMSQHTTHKFEKYLLDLVEEMILPGMRPKVDFAWGGTMGMHTDRQPIIQQMAPHLYVCVRMGGMGVALSAWASENLVKLVE